MLRRMQKIASKLLQGNEDDNQEVSWMVRQVCPHDNCDRQMFLRDIPEHWVMSHGQDVEHYKNEVLDTSDSVTHTEQGNDVRLRDLVDEYEPDWLTDSDTDEIELQEASGGHKLRAKKLRKRWEDIIGQLRSNGVVRISKEEHFGKVRGHRIVDEFERDFKRMDLDFSVETEYRSKQGIIRKV